MPQKRLCWIAAPDRFPAELTEVLDLDVVWHDTWPSALPECDAVVVEGEGDQVERWLRRRRRGSPEVWVRAHDADEELWQARGAHGVVDPGARGTALARLLVDRLARRGSPGRPSAETVAESLEMRRVLEAAREAAHSSATVLIQGETGTGKEVVARTVHAESEHAKGPFVALNCAALPDPLLESELFGHTRGAFTGAERERKGAFDEAEGGTLFLDEVGETSAAFQAKLLRVLQERAFRPLGATRSRRADVRIVAATHRLLPREVRAGRFREDLFFRLSVVPLTLPPLRERRDDVLPLAEHFLALHGERERKPGCRLAGDARRRLVARSWPGNVRELENAMLRALVRAKPGQTLGAADFDDPWEEHDPPPEILEADTDREAPLRENLDRVEAWLIRDALDRQGGHRSATARALGLTREGLYKKMKRLGIE